MTGGEIVLRFLSAQGVDVGFGIPGALNAHLYDALHSLRGDFRHILVRHELGGGWMADGFARARNEVGVAFTVPGPGATHAATAVAGAYTDCSRLLLLSSQSESHLRGEFRRDLFHGLDQQRLFAPITKWSAAVRHAEDIPEILTQAFTRLRSGRPGPVQVEIPADVLGQEAGTPGLPGFITPPIETPSADGIAQAVAALRSAQRPLILAGDGVLHADATTALGKLVTRLRAPVVTTVMGKGALPELHPWSLGDSNSAAGSAAYPEHDLLLAVGERFTQVDTRWPWFSPPRRLVHLDADAREIGRIYAPEVGLLGNVRSCLEALLAALGPDAGDRNGWDTLYPPLKARSDARADAAPIVASLRRALPNDALTAWDVCLPGFLSRKDWLSHEPHAYFYPGVYVGMGFGLPIGIGARLARPERPVCVVAGDGGFQMTLPELATAAQNEVPLVVVVVNDGGLTLIRRVQDRDFGGRRSEVELANPDFVALARAYGLPAELVTTPERLEDAVSRAASRGVLSLIELRQSEGAK
jgi:acetolactate synthase-1/2/3 large subunit